MPIRRNDAASSRAAKPSDNELLAAARALLEAHGDRMLTLDHWRRLRRAVRAAARARRRKDGISD